MHISTHTQTHSQGMCFHPGKGSFPTPSPAHSHGHLSVAEPCLVLGCSQVRTLHPVSGECASFIFKPPLPHSSWHKGDETA